MKVSSSMSRYLRAVLASTPRLPSILLAFHNCPWQWASISQNRRSVTAGMCKAEVRDISLQVRLEESFTPLRWRRIRLGEKTLRMAAAVPKPVDILRRSADFL
jgi:hypothetical protein